MVKMDVQARAIRNTEGSLLSSSTFDYLKYHVRVTLIVKSHEKLMDVVEVGKKVGLVCYNLGYLT